MYRLISLLTIIIVAWSSYPLLAAPLSLTTDEQAWLDSHREIRVGIDVAWPPFEYLDDEQRYRGISADYMALLSERLGVAFRPVTNLSWQEVLEHAERREVDLLPALMPTPQRKSYLHFSQTYLDFPMVILTRTDAPAINRLDDLQGQRVAVVRGYVTEELLRTHHPEIILVTVASVEEGLKGVVLGSHSAFVDNMASATYTINQLGISGLRVAARTEYGYPLAIGVRNDWAELVPILDKALASIDTRDINTIHAKWITDTEPGIELRTLLLIAIPAILAGVLIISLVLYWNHRLQREVNQRREIEEQLRNNSRSLLETQEIAHVGSWEWNITSGELIWSDEIFRIFGLEPQQFVPTYDAFLQTIHPNDREQVINAVNLAIQQDSRYNIEHRLIRPSGEIRVVNESGRVYRDAEGRPLRMLGVVHDITPLKFAENELRQQRDTAQRYLDIAGVMFVVIEADEHVSLINRHGIELLGYEDDQQIIGRNWFNTFIPEHNREAVRQVFQTLLSGKGNHLSSYINSVITQQGTERWINWQNTLLRSEHGHIYGVLSSGNDITEQRKNEEKLRLSDKVFEYSSEAILITDRDNHIVTTNRGFTEQTGYTLQDVLGKDPKVLSSGRHDKDFYRHMWECLQREGHWAGEVWDRRKDGKIYPKWLSINTVREPDSDQLTHYIAIFSDISQRKAAEERIQHMAHHDALTGLPNRILLQDRLAVAIAMARRNQREVALLFIDLDRFKTINDSLGHHIGDLLLQEIARRLLVCIRESDTVARLGGDEFVIVLESMHQPGDIHRVAEAVIDEVSRPVYVEHHELFVTPSIGISLSPDDGEVVEELMRKADTAMYQAKHRGGANYQFFADYMNEEANQRLELEHSLRRAVEKGELELHYQPIIDCEGKTLLGAEALLRWRHPQYGYIAPDRFIPIAEETNLILPIGEWVIRTALSHLAEWNQNTTQPLLLCINLSARQFHQTGLVEMLQKLTHENHISPRSVELEITESTLMENPQETAELMRTICMMGIDLAVDDFGTGYSSLSYLKLFPISKLKIDRSFVRDIPHDSNDAAVANAIISLAHALNLKVVAEGVETKEQLDFLHSAGCHAVQGYYFSKPLDLESFNAFRKEFAARQQDVTTDGEGSP